MKFYRVDVENHAPFLEGRDAHKIIHSQFFIQLRMPRRSACAFCVRAFD